MQRYYQIDLRELWRPGRALTLRRVGVLVKHLPIQSATMIAMGGHGWTLDEYLLADLFRVWSEQPHPADPRVAEKDKEHKPEAKDIRAARARHSARRRRLGIQGSVLRAVPDIKE